MPQEMHSIEIDFVLPVLDHTDPRWQALYRQYCKGGEGEDFTRFRDWGWLRYWLRSVAQYAPWVHRIYIVSCNPKPTWLKADGNKLVWLDHKEFIPAEYLPTFNSHTIELNLHRIQGLSEYFVYFNDDTLLNAPITPEYYFRNELPCDATLEGLFFVPHYEQGNWGTQLIEFCNVGILKKHFTRKQVVKDNWTRWYGSYLPCQSRLKAFLLSFQPQFFNFNTPHHERPLLKSIFEEVWEAEPDYLHNSCTRFRRSTNVNVYLMRLWHLASNRFWPDNARLSAHYYEIVPETLDAICKDIQEGTTPSLCLNDYSTCTPDFIDLAKARILETFSQKYPFTCCYELPNGS